MMPLYKTFSFLVMLSLSFSIAVLSLKVQAEALNTSTSKSLLRLPKSSLISPALEAERARTRAKIGEVTADQVREMDTTLTLGQQLSPDLHESVSRIEAASSRGNQPVRPYSLQAPLVGLPDLASPKSPPPKRMARREAPQQNTEQQSLVYSPDFSRQKMSFAELAGSEVLDMPELGDELASPSPSVVLSDAETWGLPDIVAEGLAVSPLLKQAVAQQNTAYSRKKQAMAELYPTASARLTAGAVNVDTVGAASESSGNYRNHALRLTQPLYNGVIFKNITNTEHGERSAELNKQDSQEVVSLSLVQATVNLAANRLTLIFADELEKHLTNVLTYLEARTQAGASSQADLERARTRVLASRQARHDQQAAYKSSLFELVRLINQTPKALRLPYLNQLPPLPQTQNELHNFVAENNLQIKALKEDVVAQESLVSAQYAKLLPTLGLSAERDIQQNTVGPSPTQTDDRLLAVMTWQISLGGKELYGAKEAEAELRNRQAKLEEATQKINQSIDSDFALLQSTTARITEGESEKRAAQAVVNAVQEQLKTGRMGSLLEALDASDRLFSARNRQIQAVSQQIVAQAQLLKQLGILSRIQVTASSDENAVVGADKKISK